MAFHNFYPAAVVDNLISHFRVFFSLNFWWGASKLTGTKSDGGDLRKKSDWSQNCPLNAKLGHFLLFKHEIQLFKILLSLKVVKFDTKMYYIFWIFGDDHEPRLGGDKPWSKSGDKCRMGGIDRIFAGWGDPPVPQEKTLHFVSLFIYFYKRW